MVHAATAAITLIDFEYGSMNFRGFDIANHFNEWAGGTEGTTPTINGELMATELEILRALWHASPFRHPRRPPPAPPSTSLSLFCRFSPPHASERRG